MGTLSIAGRAHLLTIGLPVEDGTPRAFVQDPNDASSLYFHTEPAGVTHKLWKFTWPTTLTMVKDMGMQTASYGGAVARIKGGHYGVAYYRGGQGPGVILDVDLSSPYTLTTYENAHGNGQPTETNVTYAYQDPNDSRIYFVQCWARSGTNSMFINCKELGADAGYSVQVNCGHTQQMFHGMINNDYEMIIYANQTWKTMDFSDRTPHLTADMGANWWTNWPPPEGYTSIAYNNTGIPALYHDDSLSRNFFSVWTQTGAQPNLELMFNRQLLSDDSIVQTSLGNMGVNKGGLYNSYALVERSIGSRIYWARSYYPTEPRDLVFVGLTTALDETNNVSVDSGPCVIRGIFADLPNSCVYAYHTEGDLGMVITKIADSGLAPWTMYATIIG